MHRMDNWTTRELPSAPPAFGRVFSERGNAVWHTRLPLGWASSDNQRATASRRREPRPQGAALAGSSPRRSRTHTIDRLGARRWCARRAASDKRKPRIRLTVAERGSRSACPRPLSFTPGFDHRRRATSAKRTESFRNANRSLWPSGSQTGNSSWFEGDRRVASGTRGAKLRLQFRAAQWKRPANARIGAKFTPLGAASRFGGLGGGPGRTRTCNQTVMSGRL
jgi:hypothetical protein